MKKIVNRIFISSSIHTVSDVSETHSHRPISAGESIISVRMHRSATLDWKLLHI